MTARLAAGSEKLASARMGISFSHKYPTPDPAPPPPSITHGQFSFGLPRSRILSQACTTYTIGQNAVASSTSRCYCTLPFRAQMSEKSPGRPRLLFVRKPMSSRQSNISMRRHSSDVQSHCSRLPPSPTIRISRSHTPYADKTYRYPPLLLLPPLLLGGGRPSIDECSSITSTISSPSTYYIKTHALANLILHRLS